MAGKKGYILMADLTTFAYVLIAWEWSEEAKAEISRWSYSDALELFLEREDQAAEPDDLWIRGWEQFGARLAPVQLALGWDPRPYLLALFQKVRIAPCFQKSEEDGLPNIVYFDRLPAAAYPLPVPEGPMPMCQDGTRFHDVLTATVDLARCQNRGLLFIGGWGWSYHKDRFRGDKAVLRRAGMRVVDRHA